MITKITFVKLLEAIKAQELEDDKVTKAISSIMNEDNFNNWYDTKLITATIRVLEKEVDDKYDNISYYIYELKWGGDMSLKITDEDGIDITPRSLEELYDFIIEGNK